MPTPERGEVWLADLGLAAKTRPVLVLSVSFSDRDYALVAVVPHTTSPRGSDFEVNLSVPRLRPGAFNIQGLLAIPPPRFIRRMTTLRPEHMQTIEATVRRWLGL